MGATCRQNCERGRVCEQSNPCQYRFSGRVFRFTAADSAFAATRTGDRLPSADADTERSQKAPLVSRRPLHCAGPSRARNWRSVAECCRWSRQLGLPAAAFREAGKTATRVPMSAAAQPHVHWNCLRVRTLFPLGQRAENLSSARVQNECGECNREPSRHVRVKRDSPRPKNTRETELLDENTPLVCITGCAALICLTLPGNFPSDRNSRHPEARKSNLEEPRPRGPSPDSLNPPTSLRRWCGHLRKGTGMTWSRG
jgi:hypothetical protein